MEPANIYLFPVRKRECEWEVIRLLSRGKYLGTVTAVDEEAALKAAVDRFALNMPSARKQLLIRRA